MVLTSKHKLVTINALIALAITLVVNLSYLIFSLIPIESPKFAHFLDFTSLICIISYFFVVSFILVTISTLRVDFNGNSITFIKRMLYCFVLGIFLYILAPQLTRAGDIEITLFRLKSIAHPVLMLKYSLTFIVSILYGKIYDLIYQKQNIAYENELLKRDNLENQYNILVSQINPHFFFNSLNTLTLLVREGSIDKSLDYISTLCDTFRYIINNGHSGLTPLAEELKFVESYKYLFEIRYANKLFINISVDSSLHNRLIPSLSLQPLIENAVKHNIITKSHPLTIDITSDGEYLVVSNAIQAKLTPPYSTGIGLKNLSSRFVLLSHKEVLITRDFGKFIVKLPIIVNGDESLNN